MTPRCAISPRSRVLVAELVKHLSLECGMFPILFLDPFIILHSTIYDRLFMIGLL